jgi:hypothetical protein
VNKPGLYAIADPKVAHYIGGSLHHGGGNIPVTAQMLADPRVLHLINSHQLVYVAASAKLPVPVKANANPVAAAAPSAPITTPDKGKDKGK